MRLIENRLRTLSIKECKYLQDKVFMKLKQCAMTGIGIDDQGAVRKSPREVVRVYRFGKLLPYVTHASATQNSPRTVAGVPTSGPLLALGAGANAYASAAPLQTSNSVGLRWDFYKSAALKVQYDRYTPTSRSGTFVNAKPGFTGPVNVIAAGIDFVF